MKLTVQVRLLPTDEQASFLLVTLRACNAAASFAAKAGFDAGLFSAPSIQKLCYRELRERFGLSAQMAIRAIGKAAECFKRDRSICPIFKSTGGITYDERILSWKGCDKVSILTLNGRILVPYIFGDYQKANLARLKGQVDLVYRDGKFFLFATCDIPEDPILEIKNFLGVDLGIANIATDSTGEQFSGTCVERNRKRRMTARKQYQRKGTKNAKRRLKSMSGRQRRFQTWTNHNISKRLVEKAKTLRLGIALEDLKGIRNRIEDTVGRRFRRRFGNWAFAQLRTFVEYKARLAGVPVVAVDPRNSSRACSKCGHCEKTNRKNQSEFVCMHCGLSVNADLNAALNLSAWAVRKPAPKTTDVLAST
jgi:IS605 OrfB family transposase